MTEKIKIPKGLPTKLVSELQEPDWNCRVHTDRGLTALCESIKIAGFVDPVIVWEEGLILSGSARWKAAKRLKMERVPIVDMSSLSMEEAKFYSLAANRVPEFNGFNEEKRLLLSLELTNISREVLFTEEEIEEKRKWLEDFEIETPDIPELDTEELADQETVVPRVKRLEQVEVVINIPAGMWISIQDEVVSLIKGLQDRHQEVTYAIKEAIT